jgi:hypothetical protein
VRKTDGALPIHLCLAELGGQAARWPPYGINFLTWATVVVGATVGGAFVLDDGVEGVFGFAEFADQGLEQAVEVAAVELFVVGGIEQLQEQFEGTAEVVEFAGDLAQAVEVGGDGGDFVEVGVEVVGEQQGAVSAAQGAELFLQLFEAIEGVSDHGESPTVFRSSPQLAAKQVRVANRTRVGRPGT